MTNQQLGDREKVWEKASGTTLTFLVTLHTDCGSCVQIRITYQHYERIQDLKVIAFEHVSLAVMQ